MSISINNFDTLEKIIFEEGLRIVGLHFHVELDLMLIVLSNKKVLSRRISSIEKLKHADADQLNNYRLISGGVGVHWPDIDEDLSLKGFLQYELQSVAIPNAS